MLVAIFPSLSDLTVRGSDVCVLICGKHDDVQQLQCAFVPSPSWLCVTQNRVRMLS